MELRKRKTAPVEPEAEQPSKVLCEEAPAKSTSGLGEILGANLRLISDRGDSWAKKFDDQITSLTWAPDEFPPSADHDDWKERTSEALRHLLIYCMIFFTFADKAVFANINTNFMNPTEEEALNMEDARYITCFYSKQAAQESVHEIFYTNFLRLFLDKDDLGDLEKLYEDRPSIRKKMAWVAKWMGPGVSLRRRVLAFAIVEGVFFQGAFAVILTIKETGTFRSLWGGNDLVLRDEGLHMVFAVMYFRALAEVISKEDIKQMLMEAVLLEMDFIDEALPVAFARFRPEELKDYVKATCNTLSRMLIDEELFPGVKSALSASAKLLMPMKVNFFETRNSQYYLTTAKDEGTTGDGDPFIYSKLRHTKSIFDMKEGEEEEAAVPVVPVVSVVPADSS